jgi:hypothetical protein
MAETGRARQLELEVAHLKRAARTAPAAEGT